jgi:hypothetical protein
VGRGGLGVAWAEDGLIDARSPPDATGDDWLDFVMEARRLACDRRYRERLRQLKLRFSRAA